MPHGCVEKPLSDTMMSTTYQQRVKYIALIQFKCAFQIVPSGKYYYRTDMRTI